MHTLSYLGIIGLGVMGGNLTLNTVSKGFTVSIYDKVVEKTKKLYEKASNMFEIKPTYTIEEFVNSLEKPRKIILLVPAGQPVDQILVSLSKYLDEGDIVCDCGNSFYKDTERRQDELKKKNIVLMGVGISGGKEGALKGPSIMVGGEEYGYSVMREFWRSISAKVDSEPCAGYVGSRGAGHFVKMVHNGIEYAIMESIAETYDIMRNVMMLEIPHIRDMFREWLKHDLNSYLLEITVDVLQRVDEVTNLPIVELIYDKAEQKGTGKWTTQTALDIVVPTPCIDAAVTSRVISTYKDLRTSLSRKLCESSNKNKSNLGSTELFLDHLKNSFHLAMILSYTQGLHLIKKASDEYSYNIDIVKLLKIWRGGCIIRSALLNKLIEVVERNPGIENILMDDELFKEVTGLEGSLRLLLSKLKFTNIPTPIFDSSLNYLIALKRERLPANLIQALRERFGYHGFERIDTVGRFHLD
ncbi:MAG: NADP-dependent phosphogluconate dehydrogenase [Nitrososphaerota archaeon]